MSIEIKASKEIYVGYMGIVGNLTGPEKAQVVRSTLNTLRALSVELSAAGIDPNTGTFTASSTQDDAVLTWEMGKQ
jgi:hypothetical protein